MTSAGFPRISNTCSPGWISARRRNPLVVGITVSSDKALPGPAAPAPKTSSSRLAWYRAPHAEGVYEALLGITVIVSVSEHQSSCDHLPSLRLCRAREWPSLARPDECLGSSP